MVKSDSKIIGFLQGSIKLVDTYGAIKIVFVSLLMLFMSLVAYLAINPSFIFERYLEYAEQKHTESFNYRMESTPYVQSAMRNLVMEEDAMRAFVIEMHNGKYNSSGLSFNYGSLTYEALNDNVESVMEDYADFTLDRYSVLTKVWKNGKWSGSIEELRKIDRRLALKLEANGAYYLSLTMIYGVKTEIGFVGVTFGQNSNVDKNRVENILSKYASKISPFLDGNRAKKKY
jgi:hypothetical protein